MSNLLSIAEQCHHQVFPNPGDEVKIPLEEFVATAKVEYAFQLWLRIMADKREEGELNIPSYLLSEVELPVVDNVMDISGLKIMRSLPFETWLQKIGDIDCKCNYVKSTLNLAQILCDDDSLSDSDKTYYAIGKKIKFPQGVHKSPLPIIYANGGEKIDDTIEVDDSIGGMVRRSLLEIYLGKIAKEDKTNNTASDA